MAVGQVEALNRGRARAREQMPRLTSGRTMNTFSPEAFFDFVHGPAAALFQNITQVWEAVAALPGFIERIITPHLKGKCEAGAWLEPGMVQLEPGSLVERGAIVRGPTIIGRNTVIRSGAYIRGHVMVGEDCLIGHGTEIRQTLVLNQSNIPHLNCFFTSVVGNRVKIGGCANTANVLLSGKEVQIHLTLDDESRTFFTGQTKFGAIIGDDTNVGGNALLHPGTIIGRRCQVYPQCPVSGYIPHDSLVRPRSAGFDIISRATRELHPEDRAPA
jgi:acetyltransferase-like isoleucine patch superfamily enzyme